MIFSLALGLCRSFKYALIIRFMSGFFAGNTPVSKSLIREVTTNKNISKLYSYFSLGVGIGAVAGPFIAGLSNPAENIGGIFDNEFFRMYPYFLQFFFLYYLFSFLSSLFTFIITCIYLENSKVIKQESDSKAAGLIENSNYIIAISIFGMLAFYQFAIRLLFSLICKSNTKIGGFGMPEENISLIQGFGGIFVLVLPTLVTPIFEKKFGLVKSIFFLAISLIPFTGFISYLAIFPLYLQYIIFTTLFGLINSLTSVYIYYISICISNSVNSNILGIANGFSQALTGMCRFISTTSIGLIYGWSVTNGKTIPGVDIHFSFLLLEFILIGQAILIKFKLHPSLEKKMENTDLELLLVKIKDT